MKCQNRHPGRCSSSSPRSSAMPGVSSVEIFQAERYAAAGIAGPFVQDNSPAPAAACCVGCICKIPMPRESWLRCSRAVCAMSR